jgi:putative DNA primase/helicase
MDKNPWLFNVENGTIDVKHGVFREHRREDAAQRIGTGKIAHG